MKQLVLPIIALLTLSGCAADISPDSYSVGAVGQASRTVQGKIIHARTVNVKGNQTGVGAVAGGLGGGVAGSSIGGSGRANAIGAIGGAVAGGIAGALIEEGISRQQGMEYVIETEYGSLVTVVQGPEPRLHAGNRVLLIYGSPTRVIRYR